MTTTHPAELGKANIQCTQNRTAYSIYVNYPASFTFFNMPYYAPALLYTALIYPNESLFAASIIDHQFQPRHQLLFSNF